MFSDRNHPLEPEFNTELLGWDSNQKRVYGQVLFDLTPENADQVEEDIQLELLGLQEEGGRLPFFLMVFTFNQITGKIKHFLTRYTYSRLKTLIDTVRDPTHVWENYERSSPEEKSDLEAIIHTILGTSLDQEGDEGLYEVAQIGLWHPNFALEMNQSDRNIIYRDFPETGHFPVEGTGFTRIVGRFMRYWFDETCFQKLLEKDPSNKELWFWLELKRRPNIGEELESRYQISWFVQNPNYNEKEGKPFNSIYAIPCAAYALKGQISDEHYEELYAQPFITTEGVKTAHLRRFLNPRGYRLVVHQIEVQNNKYKSRPHYYPSKPEEGMKDVIINCWGGHWFREDGYIEHFLVRLEKAKELGILKPFNAFEFEQKYENLSFDAMLDFDANKFVEEHPDEYTFTNSDYEIPEYKKRNTIERLYFADFEATTDEHFHKPFLLCAKGVDALTENGQLVFADREEYSLWGENCAKNFLDSLLKLYGERNPRRKDPRCRVYFHNLKYDFTFLLPWLSDIHEVTKEGKLYSVKACYKNRGMKCYIDFWDSLPIFQCSLERAVNDFLTEEEREKMGIRKEAFPYQYYTYEMFQEKADDWRTIESAKGKFSTDSKIDEAKYLQFVTNLKRTLPFIPEYEDLSNEYGTVWGHRLSYVSNMCKQEEYEYHYSSDRMYYQNYDRHEEEYTEEFNYKTYAEFYCMQDVRCLAAIVVKFAQLLIGKGCEGVHGTPPFSLDLRSYRTASSLGFDYFQRRVMFKQNEKGEWVPRHEWAMPKNSLRAIVQKTVRGGRVMTRDNQKWHYEAKDEKTIIQDYDAVSLYPSAMSKLWLSDGIPKLIKGKYGKREFLTWFADPEDDSNRRRFKDGCIHLTRLNTRRKLHFPMLCIKDEKTKLNTYKNFDNEEVDTWVNAIDLFNLVEFQDAEFDWNAAIVWEGSRHYEIRTAIRDLFHFRFLNHGKYADEEGGLVYKHEHPIQNVAKLMMNSIYGKSVLKVSNKEKMIVEATRWQKNKETGAFEEYDNWLKFFKANLYRVKKITNLSPTLSEVEIYKRDTSASMNIFGSNVLAMARRLIGRVMSLAEELEERYPWMAPGLFYTDTDSMHITNQLLKVTEDVFAARYHHPLRGEELGQFHPDFDAPKGFHKDERVKGAVESWFIAKKMYADKLEGTEGSIGYHLRMKGIPTDQIKFEQYAEIYANKPVTFDLLIGHCSFFYQNGKVGSRSELKRTIMTKEAREQLKLTRKRARSESPSPNPSPSPKRAHLGSVSEDEEAQQDDFAFQASSFDWEDLAAEEARRDGLLITDDADTVLLPLSPPSEQELQIDESQVIDIE